MKRSAEMLRRGGEVVRNGNGFWPTNHDHYIVKRKQVNNAVDVKKSERSDLHRL